MLTRAAAEGGIKVVLHLLSGGAGVPLQQPATATLGLTQQLAEMSEF